MIYKNVLLDRSQHALYVTEALQRDQSLGTHIESLDLHLGENVSADALAAGLLSLTPNLISLSIKSDLTKADNETNDESSDHGQLSSLMATRNYSDGKLRLKHCLPRLKSCSVEYSEPWSAADKLPFFAKVGLTSLTLNYIFGGNISPSDLFPEAFRTSDITDLTISGQVEAKDFHSILSFPRALKHLKFHYEHYDKALQSDEVDSKSGRLYWTALEQHRQFLEVLEVCGPFNWPSGSHQPILANFNTLKSLTSTSIFLGNVNKADEEDWLSLLPKSVSHFVLTKAPRRSLLY